ncbi:MAG: homoserine O-succinyltransferase [Alphaproteobacteria bacterium]|nr:MAG: homoserine O-succinyltransferase [Alphaproteobacteria bacterium]
MPIRIPENLPAFDVLRREGVMVMDESVAERQDIRPLQIGLLNLMPKKIETETQFARLIGATPLQIELTLIRMTHHRPRNTSPEHLHAFYQPFAAVRERKFDGLIITGAPIEHLPYEEVTYWDELQEIFAWTQSHVHSTFAVCWGGMAWLYHFYGIPKHILPAKAFGCFRHENRAPTSPYLRGFSDDCVVPVSRWTEIRQEDVDARPELRTLLASREVGPCLVEDPAHRALCIFNHFEYDTETLKGEYERDLAKGAPIAPPVNYFPDDDPTRPPVNRWRSHAHLLFGNWINEIYQTTPFEIDRIGR